MVVAVLDPGVTPRLSIKLFRDVENAQELYNKATSGQLQCCLVNPKLVLNSFQIIVAANRALYSKIKITKSVFTEILFNLSVSKNISKSLQQFGMDPTSTDILVVTVSRTLNDDVDAIISQIKGREVDMKELSQIHDLSAIRSAYRIGDSEEDGSSLYDSVISRIATKHFISH